MALVAYDDSDNAGSSSDEDDVPLNVNKSSVFSSDTTSKEESDDSLITNTKSSLFSSLPAPKSTAIVGETENEEAPIPALQKLEQTVKSKKNENKRPKIVVPSINYDDDEEEEPKPKVQKTAPSTKGSGLFSILPPPKNSVTNKSLIPHTVKNLQAKTSKPMVKPSINKLLQGKLTSETDSVDVGSNFFNLGDDKQDNLVSSANQTHFDDPITIPRKKTPQLGTNTRNYSEKMENYQHTGPGSVPNVHYPAAEPYYNYAAASASNVGPGEVQHYEYPSPNASNEDQPSLPTELQRIAGKKKEDIVFIDIKDESKEVRDQWRLRALTEEQPHMASAGHGPSGAHRRKHQITYLAHQAKEREIELKNEWAQNRSVRQQTRSKYGF